MASLAVAPAAANVGAPNIKDFATNLARYPTTSEALTEWCGKEKIVREPIIRVQILPEAAVPPVAIRRLLEARPDVRLGYRHVHIACQNTVLVDGHNWFVPSLLTP